MLSFFNKFVYYCFEMKAELFTRFSIFSSNNSYGKAKR